MRVFHSNAGLLIIYRKPLTMDSFLRASHS